MSKRNETRREHRIRKPARNREFTIQKPVCHARELLPGVRPAAVRSFVSKYADGVFLAIRCFPDPTPPEFRQSGGAVVSGNPRGRFCRRVHTSGDWHLHIKIAASAACCASHARRDPSHARSSDTPGRNPPPDSISARETAAPRRPSRIFGARGNTNWSACARAEQLKTRCRSPPRRRPPRSPPPRRSPRPR